MARFDETELWSLCWGSLAARALALAADHRVADALVDGPRHVEEFARDVGADADALRRILRALATRGVFAEESRGVFRNTEGSEALRNPDGLADFAHLFGGSGEQLEFVQSSSFEAVPRADAYVLSTILHDWDDESAGRILRAIRSSAPAGARLLALDAVIPDGNEPHGAKWLDLLVLALFAGRERDEEQWRTLLEANGFEPVAGRDGLVEARCR